MIRRRFLTLSATALTLTPLSGFAAYEAMPYDRTLPRRLREEGRKVIYNFRTEWSLTCRIKQDLLAELLTENSAYRTLTFVDVNWDIYGPSVWVERLKVRRQSTLVAMKGESEIARIENEPDKDRLRDLLDAALAA
ncbi:MAG: thioredoxin [Rhodobacteraceae bacterium]|nr:MAG: thioredoxin [Paracoccaceae bacterium]